ncbi:60 kDa SS-A/Ro ribonucleoprotein [Mytilus galloprovincialis]|uniref:60 kDa SS-A/Ro ribonucleoprotein n=1 Tax=Mytilus galloprovincialis TaxID=29158 RepID=A0A8B6BMA9_MYTGA|nr:60 kDa SS-A/Ro ribonucleoprotein [Mytilus galloprovincialis]
MSFLNQTQPSGNPVPQMEALVGQAKNKAGGFSYEVDDFTRLLRFLILGAEGGTYYSSEKELKRENVQSIDRLIMTDQGENVVKLIRDVSVNGRACKQNTTIYALSVCARSNDLKTKNAAYRALSDICRIPTHLFEFVKYCENESAGSGWGRAHRVAIGKWYNSTSYKREPQKLAYHVTKYQSRHSWNHKDVLRLAHVKPETDAINKVIKYIIKGLNEAKADPMPMDGDKEVQEVLDFLEGVENAKKCSRQEIEKMKGLIAMHELAREHVPTTMLDSVEIWDVLLRQMPMTAMIRNLGKMSSLQMFKKGEFAETLVIEKLGNRDILKNSKIHPFTIMIAWYQYQAGRGEKGKLSWPVNDKIVNALEGAFYKAFEFVEPTNKRYLLAVDVSGSMTAPVHGSSQITCRDASAAMMLLAAKTEKTFDVLAFSENFTKLDVSATDNLKSVIDKCSSLPFQRTDCSLPMQYACKNKKQYDVFVVYTDSETFFGNMHPSKALEEYRKYSGILDSRLIVCGMATNGFSIADPSDKFMMDVVGFDTNAPKAMASFVKGEL